MPLPRGAGYRLCACRAQHRASYVTCPGGGGIRWDGRGAGLAKAPGWCLGGLSAPPHSRGSQRPSTLTEAPSQSSFATAEPGDDLCSEWPGAQPGAGQARPSVQPAQRPGCRPACPQPVPRAGHGRHTAWSPALSAGLISHPGQK